ncbi:CYTH domain-containing protein [Novosphingobium album (ex Liu et al. 2023)]|uniref:CYTH domain-containing protein n=1 Tax=Novosphingobium album (ex Liu et al. 2023) TaxID=3031130 RepID=A0ABT5WSI8_9SPHN|nr:CYTH domain-containing protein [Novosphingobium album (ex Liu et al. 2023)]MDE8653015.1 CYTH domain-containing protein [Novosphingobium album (ex Liu et al. 2023)]
MAREIERKFLVAGDAWRRAAGEGQRIRQAYLASGGPAEIRVRICDGARAVLTIKSAAPGLSRAEFEYPIPLADAEELIALRTGGCLEKRRFTIPADAGLRWEIDVFAGTHQGLCLAEIELASPDQAFAMPDWLGAEVTGDPRYYNATLARTA